MHIVFNTLHFFLAALFWRLSEKPPTSTPFISARFNIQIKKTKIEEPSKMWQQSSVPAAFAFTQSDRILQTNVRSSTGISCRLWARIWLGLNPRWLQRANLSNVPSHLRSRPCQFFVLFFFWIFIFHKEESVSPSGEGERFLFRMCCFPTEEPSLNSFLTLKELQQQLRCRWNDSHFCSHCSFWSWTLPERRRLF